MNKVMKNNRKSNNINTNKNNMEGLNWYED